MKERICHKLYDERHLRNLAKQLICGCVDAVKNFKRLVPNTQIRSIKAEITMTMTFVHLGRGFVSNYKQYLSLKCGSF